MSRERPARDRARRFWRSRAGSIAPMFALLLVPMIGMLGMAGEGSSWFLTQRAAQYTADQAALAAAANNCAPGAGCATSGTTYVQEAAAVSQGYNFVTGANNTTVVADIAGTPAPPCGTSTCYRVTITRNMPVFLMRVVGFNGNATTSTGQAATAVSAVGIARRAKTNAMFCATVLSSNDTAFQVNGASNLDLSSCTIFAPNGGASCTNQAGSHVQGAYVGSTGKTNDNCGSEQPTSLQLQDPYNALESNLPKPADLGPGRTVCSGGFPQDGDKNHPLPASNILPTSTRSFSISSPFCGDVRLEGDVTVSGNSVLLIENGHLDLNGHKLFTPSGASLTIIFSGTSDTKYEHFVCSSAITPSNCTSSQNDGVLDFSAPNSGTWSGVAIYQDPRLPTTPTGKNLNLIASGSSPQWDITGMVYAPLANVQFNGAINHATQGLACLTFFVNSILVNGTASIFAKPTSQCQQAGLDPGGVQTLEKLVMVQ